MLYLPVTETPDQLSRWLKLGAAALLFQVLFPAPVVAMGPPASLDEELTQALDLEPDLENGKALFEMCASCHGPDAQGSRDGVYPQLAGQHRSVIIKQISDFRLGNRANPDMLPFTETDVFGGPQGISDVASYLASLPMTPEPGVGPEDTFARGEKVYEDNCSVCHDDGAEGFDDFFFPKIQGQHYGYTLRELKKMKEGERKNVYHGMLRRIQKLSMEDLEAVANYVSRLPPTGGEDELSE